MVRIRPTAATPPGITARVVRVDASGAWVTPLGDDVRDVILGPCRGATPPAGALVCLIVTQEQPWVVAYEEVD